MESLRLDNWTFKICQLLKMLAFEVVKCPEGHSTWQLSSFGKSALKFIFVVNNFTVSGAPSATNMAMMTLLLSASAVDGHKLKIVCTENKVKQQGFFFSGFFLAQQFLPFLHFTKVTRVFFGLFSSYFLWNISTSPYMHFMVSKKCIFVVLVSYYVCLHFLIQYTLGGILGSRDY